MYIGVNDGRRPPEHLKKINYSVLYSLSAHVGFVNSKGYPKFLFPLSYSYLWIVLCHLLTFSKDTMKIKCSNT